MNINCFFKINKNPEDISEEFQRLQRKSDLLKLNPKFVSNLEIILEVFHNAHSVDGKRFIIEILFEFQATKHKFKRQQNRVYEEMSRLSEFEPESIKEKIYLVNVYRNTISDLFDPYISIIYASLQLVEGKFENYLTANLGQGERNKVEYCISKLKTNNPFSSYNPIVRNAISHAGSDGVAYTNENILFKSIKRGKPPRVESVTWSSNELAGNITDLICLTQLIDYAIDIFNLDVLDLIRNDKDISHKYIDEVLDRNDRKHLQEPFDRIVEKITSNSDIGIEEKYEELTNFFFLECSKRNLNVIRVSFHEKSQTAMIEVKDLVVNVELQNNVYEAILVALSYGIAAEPCYRNLIEHYVIFGEGEENNQLRVEAPSSIFNDYNEEKCGLLDLAAETKASVGSIILKVHVDLEKLEEIESNSLNRKFPRRGKPI